MVAVTTSDPWSLVYDHQHQDSDPANVDVVALRKHLQQAHGAVTDSETSVAALGVMHRVRHTDDALPDPAWSSYGRALGHSYGAVPAEDAEVLRAAYGADAIRDVLSALVSPPDNCPTCGSGYRDVQLTAAGNVGVCPDRWHQSLYGETHVDESRAPTPTQAAHACSTADDRVTQLADRLARQRAALLGTPVDAVDRNGAPMPIPNDGPSVHDLVVQDVQERKELGLRRYGSLLQADNGRNALRDMYEELLDAACYVRQRLEEEAARPVTVLAHDDVERLHVLVATAHRGMVPTGPILEILRTAETRQRVAELPSSSTLDLTCANCGTTALVTSGKPHHLPS